MPSGYLQHGSYPIVYQGSQQLVLEPITIAFSDDSFMEQFKASPSTNLWRILDEHIRDHCRERKKGNLRAETLESLADIAAMLETPREALEDEQQEERAAAVQQDCNTDRYWRSRSSSSTPARRSCQDTRSEAYIIWILPNSNSLPPGLSSSGLLR